MIESYIRLKEVLEIVQERESTWYQRIKGKALQTAILSPRSTRWSKIDIDAVMASISTVLQNRGTK